MIPGILKPSKDRLLWLGIGVFVVPMVVRKVRGA